MKEGILPEKTGMWSVERNGGSEVERPHFAKPQPRTAFVSLVDKVLAWVRPTKTL